MRWDFQSRNDHDIASQRILLVPWDSPSVPFPLLRVARRVFQVACGLTGIRRSGRPRGSLCAVGVRSLPVGGDEFAVAARSEAPDLEVEISYLSGQVFPALEGVLEQYGLRLGDDDLRAAVALVGQWKALDRPAASGYAGMHETRPDPRHSLDTSGEQCGVAYESHLTRGGRIVGEVILRG